MPETQTIVIAGAALVLLWLFRDLVIETLQTRLAMVIIGCGGVGFYLGFTTLSSMTMPSLPSLPF